MASTQMTTESDVATSGNPEDVVHIVGGAQGWLDRLGLKVPRALCGFLLVADPDKADPMDLGAPLCGTCVAIKDAKP